MPQFEDFKVVGVLFVGFGLLQLGAGATALSEQALGEDIGAIATVALGVLNLVVGVGSFRQERGHQIAAGVCALLAAPTFPVGTVFAAVAFIAIGKAWARYEDAKKRHESDAA